MGKRIASFVDAANLPVVMINKLQAAPNTKLWDRLKMEGRLRNQLGSGNSTVGEFNYVPSRSEDEIEHEFVNLWNHVYDPSNFLTRTYNYYLTMRPTRKAMAKLRGVKVLKDRPHERPTVSKSTAGRISIYTVVLAPRCNIERKDPILEAILRYTLEEPEPVHSVSHSVRYGGRHV